MKIHVRYKATIYAYIFMDFSPWLSLAEYETPWSSVRKYIFQLEKWIQIFQSWALSQAT